MKKLLLLIAVLVLVLQSVIAVDNILINSADWRDVYSGMIYGSLTKTTTSFLVSDKHSTLILNSIIKGSSIRAISSKKSPFIVGYKSILSSNGYNASEDIYENVNLELGKQLDVKNFVIVDDAYGYNAISVAPYAVASNSYVLFANRNNFRDIDAFLSKETIGKVIIYGQMPREARNALAKYNPEIINKEGDRFANNIEISKKYIEIRGARQAILTNGEFIEKEIMSGVEPVIFIGTNNVPDQIREFIQKSNIEVGVLVGNELVGTATAIRRDVGISVFVKFAQGARAPKGAISQVEALDMFYLPVYTLKIELDSIRYNRATRQLEVNLRNTEDQAVYFKGTYTLGASDGSEQRVGDIDPVFLDGKELKTMVYDVEPLPEGSLTAKVYVIYGESKGSMEKVLDLTFPVESVEILDDCEISLNSLEYDKRKGIFYIGIENTGKADCYINTELIDVLVDNEKQSFSADKILYLKEGQKKSQMVTAKLTDEDIEANEEVRVRAYYGQREDSLVKVLETKFKMQLKGVDYVFYALLIIIIILIFLILWRRRKKKKEEE